MGKKNYWFTAGFFGFIVVIDEPDHIRTDTYLRHPQRDMELLQQEKVGGVFGLGHRIGIIPSDNPPCDFGSDGNLWP